MKRIATALALTILVPLSFARAQQPQPQAQPRPTQPAQQPAQAQPQRPAATAPATANPVRPEQVPAGGAPKAVPGLGSDKQKFSYGVGLSIGGDMRGQLLTPDDLDLQALLRGLSDALADGKPALSRDELK